MVSAQVSAEFSLLLLISIAVLAIVIATVQSMSGIFNKSLSKRVELYDRDGLASRIEEVCLSGSGSSRVMQLISTVDSLNQSFPCQVSATFPLSGKLVIKNNKGTVEIN
ncbi:MAG: hypothetical protein D6769_00915 [Methanobacteriota archaeon]|nr:MAG: hypothetical protein D6769_00915 [Euryarchaeota archaeon]